MNGLPIISMEDHGAGPCITIDVPSVTEVGFLAVRLAWVEQMAAVESGLRAAEDQWMRDNAASLLEEAP